VSATALPSDVEIYLARVRAALADVPPEERDELLAEVESSLYETASETDGPVSARLGPAEEFAAELRAAAGLHGESSTSLRDTLRGLVANPRVRAAGAVLKELAPIWWVARGYIAVAAIALAFDTRWSWSYRAVPIVGGTMGGLTLIALAIVASIALGLWARHRGALGRPLLALDAVALLVGAFAVVPHLAQPTIVPNVVLAESTPVVAQGLVYNGNPVQNIYPYSRDGKLLLDVQLFTGAGAPIQMRSQSPDPLRRGVVTKRGVSVYNVYPLRYFESGTQRIVNPKAAPFARAPKIATPSLVRKVRVQQPK